MKKVITAINNPKLNEELKKENNFEIIGKDIQYKEAILEILEKNKNIDLIIISEQILGEINFEYLIKKINLINEKIKIIFILEKENNYLENILIKNNIKDIYYNDEINLFELIKIINKNEINMEEEIIKLKNIIKENNINYNKLKNNYLKNNKNKINNRINNKEKNIKNNYKKNNMKNTKKFKLNKNILKKNKIIKKENKKIIKNKLKKTIIFSGNYKSGKSTISLIISTYLSKMNYKVLLIDGDLEKQDLSFIINMNWKNNKNYNKEKLKNNTKINNKKIKNINNNYFFQYYFFKNKNKNESNLNKYKINFFYLKNIINLYTKKINNNLYFFYVLNYLLNNKKNKSNQNNNILKKQINIFFNIIKNKYDFIIIELSKNNPDILNKELLNISNLNFVIAESNILSLNEINNLLNIYFYKWKIKKNNLQIILNKFNINSINEKLISNFFNFKNKIHKIKENKFYFIFLNNFNKINILLKNKNIKKYMKNIIYEIKK